MLRRRFYNKIVGGKSEVNLAPLIDMIFILLIFFLVTTSFVKETGIDVHRPSASVAESLKRESLFIAIAEDGSIHMNNRAIGILSVRARIREQLRLKELPIVVIADREAPTKYLVDVIDECKIAGASKISLAAERK